MKISNRSFIIAAVFVSLFLAVFISPFASSSPDGLEKVAAEKGFMEHAEAEGVTAWEASPIPDYAMPGVKNEKAATALAGLIGTGSIFVIGYALAKLMAKKNKTA